MFSFRGSGYIELASGYDYDPRSGRTSIRSFLGSPTAIASLAATHEAAGRRVSMDPQGDGSYLLKVRFGADEDQPKNEALSELWELDGNDIEQDVFKLPLVKAMLSTVTDPASRSAIRKNLKALVDGETTSPTDDHALTFDYLWQFMNNRGVKATITLDGKSKVTKLMLRALVEEMVDGLQEFPVSQYVLRRTVIVADNAGDSLKPAYDDVNRVLSTSALKLKEHIPTALKFRLPDGYWLKRTPRVSAEDRERWRVVNEWWWSDDYASSVYNPIE